MALAGTHTQCYFFWLLAILSIIYCIAGLTAFLQPHLFFPTPNSTEYEAQSRLFMEAEGNIPVQHSTPRIYMLNLPRRTDRRERMMRLQAATGLSWIFVDSTDSKAEIVTRIMERVRWIRAAAHLHAIDANFHGWWSDHHGNSFKWTHMPNGSESEPSSELWELARSDPASADHTHPLPIPPSVDQRPPLEVATSIIPRTGATRDSRQAPLFNTNPNSARSATRNVTSTLGPRLRKLPYWRILTRAAIACWHSHIRVIREIASETIQAGTPDIGVLILEDDIDMEVDILQRIGRLWEALPPDWDILFLGHCWSAEDTYPALRSHDQLHPSHSPKCTHAYALSRKGARRLVQLLRDPSVAYGRPLDAAFLDLVQSNLVNAYSVHPSVIIQTKDTPSDIFPGNGSRWRDVLEMPALNDTGKF
ncbi:hypothetical protein B0J17DRAFT_722387 [Rhizoctonia solani]|nr:hypothetical protein B0J17DRAFT_722387 [Rhizoctonia solani]